MARRVEVDGDQFRSIDEDCAQCGGTGSVQVYDPEVGGGIRTHCECSEYPTRVVCGHCNREVALDLSPSRKEWVVIHYESGLPDCYHSPWWVARVATPALEVAP